MIQYNQLERRWFYLIVAIIIIVFLYTICGNIPNNVYGINFLDAFLIINAIIGFIYGFVATIPKKTKNGNKKRKQNKRR